MSEFDERFSRPYDPEVANGDRWFFRSRGPVIRAPLYRPDPAPLAALASLACVGSDVRAVEVTAAVARAFGCLAITLAIVHGLEHWTSAAGTFPNAAAFHRTMERNLEQAAEFAAKGAR